MIDYIDLTNAMAAKLGSIPDLVAMLAPEDPIQPYIDMNPVKNSVATAIYQMQPGQLLVVWTDTVMERGTMSKWLHVVEICVRALPGQSDLTLIRTILNGVPYPGDGLIWRMCPIMPGLLPTDVLRIERRTDTEGVDYGVILTETAETGDWPFP
jgi:hypothetical protein